MKLRIWNIPSWRLLFFPLPYLTGLLLPYKWDRLREDTLTFNHLYFQYTRMYLLRLVRLARHLNATLQSSCLIPCYEIETILNRHSRYILPHAHIEIISKIITWLRLNVGYIWENRLTNILELVSQGFPISNTSFELVALIHNVTSNDYEVLAFLPRKKLILVELLIPFFWRDKSFEGSYFSTFFL